MAKSNFKAADIIPHKCGIVLTPPAVIFIYENRITKQLRKLLMPVHNISVNSDIEFFAEDLKMRHRPLLDLVKVEKLKKMIFLLVQHKEGVTINNALIKFSEMGNDENSFKQTNVDDNFLKTINPDFDEDLAADTDMDDLDAPIDKLGIYSDDEADHFWQ